MGKLIRFPPQLPPDPLAGCHLIVDTQAAPERRSFPKHIIRLCAVVSCLSVCLAIHLVTGCSIFKLAAVAIVIKALVAYWRQM